LKLFPLAKINNGAGTSYVPFIGDNNQVGYACQRSGLPTQYITLNPSTIDPDDPEDTPAVFVYIGDSGDPAVDGAAHYYSVPE
jgi:hypothetical protein